MKIQNFTPKRYVLYAYYNHDCYNIDFCQSFMDLVKSETTNSQIKTQRKYHTCMIGENLHVQ